MLDVEITFYIINVVLTIIVTVVTASFYMGKYQNKVDSLEKKVEGLEKKSEDHSTKITKCETIIDERTQNLAQTLTKRKSPLSLSPKGEQLLKESASDKFILENQAELVEKIRIRSPKTAYDVQEYTKEAIVSMKDDDRFNKLKEYAFKEGIDIDGIFIVMGIYLRDIALPLLGFSPEDIDKDAPPQREDS